MEAFDKVRAVLGNVLSLGDRAGQLRADTQLLGGIPEFDSMAVVSVVGALEDEFDIVVDDDELTADVFATVGSLVDFLQTKTSA